MYSPILNTVNTVAEKLFQASKGVDYEPDFLTPTPCPPCLKFQARALNSALCAARASGHGWVLVRPCVGRATRGFKSRIFQELIRAVGFEKRFAARWLPRQ
jgi:hypothetical protein